MAPHTVIRLSERSAGEGTFRVRVEFGDEAEYDVDVTDPADAASEQELAWYFEEHLRYPFLDKDREEQAVTKIAAYGEALFRQVFGGGDASHDYRKQREQAFDNCRMEISGSAALHRLHWEALRDPDYPGTPLSVWLPVTRRVGAQPSKFAIRDGLPALNILVVTARPGGPHDVGYRTISRPLLAALRNSDQPVTLDLVRPGTWDALRDHLAAATREHGSGWYQVIHFDLHGAFTGYPALAQGAGEGTLRFSPGALPPFDGQRGFLFFETERDDVAHPVPAETVASLLAEHRVPVAVLNACQSAMQTVSEAGLAQRLAEAGVPVTVGMAYSVTVTAAENSMPVLYEQLSSGVDPVAAVHAARRELFEHRGRRAYFDQQLDLEDWMLPVVFGQRALRVSLRDMTDAERAEFFERSADVGDEPATEYGFVGRDLDIQTVERRLLAGKDSNELLVRGMAGAGKSTLLAHLAWWWQRTGLVAHAFGFSYEDRAWTASQIIRDIRAKLFTPAEHAAADSLSDAAQMEQVAQRLRAHRHLLILDNAESITAAPASIPHALSGPEQAKLKTLLSRLRGGRTLVLLGSRGPEDWLTSGNTGPGIYPLPGLDPQASSVLVDRILSRHGGTRHLENPAEHEALQDLVQLLGGYPLPLTVVLPVLAASKPSEVLAELREGGPGADPTGLIHRAIEYSHGKLDESLQNSLLLLAPFTSVIPTGPFLELYQELLEQDEAVHALGQIDLAVALNQAVSVGLAATHPVLDYLVQVQPVLPYFLRSRLHDQHAVRKALTQAHYKLYSDSAVALYKLLTASAPQQRAIGMAAVKAEYANLTAALSHALESAQPISSLLATLEEYLDQAQQHGTRRQLLDEAIARYPEPTTGQQKYELAQLHDLAGATALSQHREADAEAHYRKELDLWETVGERRSQSVAYHQLGIVALRQRQFQAAKDSFRRALDIYLELGDRIRAAETESQIGSVAQREGRFKEAEASFRRALETFLELDDRYRAALAYHNLGVALQQQGRTEEARSSYHNSLELKIEFSDWPNAARTYYQLGSLAQDLRQYVEAETYYRKALDIDLELKDVYSTGDIFYQLSRLALARGRLDEAEANARKSLDIFTQFKEPNSIGLLHTQLGEIAQAQQRKDEAEAHYRNAIEILQATDVEAASSAATKLGQLLVQQDRHDEAATVIMYAALSWYERAGRWHTMDLQLLRRTRALVDPETFSALVRENIPEELAGDLIAAIDATEDPPEAGGPGEPGPGDNG
jgi:tetratricopeptide (TPR) repeat protein